MTPVSRLVPPSAGARHPGYPPPYGGPGFGPGGRRGGADEDPQARKDAAEASQRNHKAEVARLKVGGVLARGLVPGRES